MRIDLPFSSWVEAQRAQDDAHTLTVPAQHPQAAAHPLLAAWSAGAAAGLRVEVPALEPVTVTLTF